MKQYQEQQILERESLMRSFLRTYQLQEVSTILKGNKCSCEQEKQIRNWEYQFKRLIGAPIEKDGLALIHYYLQTNHWYIISVSTENLSQAYGLTVLNDDVDASDIGIIDLDVLANSNAVFDQHWDPICLPKVLDAFNVPKSQFH